MRKVQFICVSMMFVLLAFANSISAVETKKLEYFSVGATVTELGNNEFKVETKGEKVEEGFVYTPATPSTTSIKYKVTLKGEGEIVLKLEETDPRGTFLKEEKSQPIQLSDEWKEYELTTNISSTQSQVDVFVLTSTKQATTFHFKNVEVLNE